MGANLLNNESPMGDKQSSPKVCIIYIPINQIILTLTPAPTPLTPVAIHKYPSANSIKPIAILKGEEGSLFILPNLIQIHATKGAKVTTKIELSDWKKLVGTSKNPKSLCVFSEAK